MRYFHLIFILIFITTWISTLNQVDASTQVLNGTTMLLNGRPVERESVFFIASLRQVTNQSQQSKAQISDAQGSFCAVTRLGWMTFLTAAHCVTGKLPNELMILVGKVDLDDAKAGMRIQVEEVRGHPQYNPKTIEFDIALIRGRIQNWQGLKSNRQDLLDALALPSSFVQLDTRSLSYEGSPQIVYGWGMTLNQGLPTILHRAQLRVKNTEKCNQAWLTSPMFFNQSRAVFPSNLCAGGQEDGASIGDGDSGGPMGVYQTLRSPLSQSQTYQAFVQTGVASWTELDNRSIGRPSVFVRIASVREWIIRNANQLMRCPPGFGSSPVKEGELLQCWPCGTGTFQSEFSQSPCKKCTQPTCNRESGQ